MTIGITAIIVAILVWYALSGRAWLKTKPWARPFFASIEPIEIALFKKSETILFARMKMLIGVTLTLLTSLGSIDLTPIMPFVPDKYAGMAHAVLNLLPMVITLMGMVDEKLRNSVTKPIELVAIPDKVVEANPKIAEAVEMADATKTEAVAAVTKAKAA